ncbi:hypothetical protein AB0G06_43390 [Nonomuraea dietziae]
MKREHIEQAAHDVHVAVIELESHGFNSEEAIKLAYLVLMHADRKAFK